MQPDIIIVPVVFLIPAAVVALRMWLRHTEKMASLGARERSPDMDARIARIEQAVEAIAVEVERVGEGQRFMTRLLAERSAEATHRPEAE